VTGLHCGIDIGSTNLKVVLLDEDGRVAFSRAVPAPRVADGTAIATDAPALVAELEALIIEGWRSCGHRAPLRSISTAGVGEDGVCVTKGLRPTGLAIPWFDLRAREEAALLQSVKEALSNTGIAVAADRTAAKWLWLSRHRPSEFQDAAHWITLTDFPLVHWSGRPFMSLSLAPRTGCYDVFARRWLDEMLAAAHAPPLPPLIPAGGVVGGMAKGPLRDSGAASADTLLVAGGHDHPMAAVVLRALAAEARVDSVGTANLVYGETSALFEAQATPELSFSLPPQGMLGVSCLGVMEFSNHMQPVRKDEAVFQAALRRPRFAGIPGAIDDSEEGAIRRAFEAISLRARLMFDAMADLGVPDRPIYMTGGWSRSTALAELRATIFGEAVHTVGHVELVAASAALLAAEAATGQALPLSHLVQPRQIDPVPAWLRAYEDMRATLKGSAAIPQ